jgi:hypothetical protein
VPFRDTNPDAGLENERRWKVRERFGVSIVDGDTRVDEEAVEGLLLPPVLLILALLE